MTDQHIAAAVEAERMVLSAMMHDGAEAASRHVTPGDFHEYRHAVLFDHLLELWGAGQPTDPVALLKRLADRDELTRPETGTYLHSVYALDASPLQVGYYAGIILEAAEQRHQAVIAAKLGRAAEISDPEARRAQFAQIVGEATAERSPARATRPKYGDVAALLADGIPDPPQPEVLHRADGHALLYAAKVNVLYGDSESGKTWIALAAVAEVLAAGGKAAVVDLDHNGMAETVTRLLSLGAKAADLADTNRFRYCEPGEAEELDYFVADIAAWSPWVVVADSVGEILPMLGLSSNSPDEYTAGNRRVLTPLADAGAAVIAIDHLPKDDGAREKGQTGTMAKKRAINGVSLRVTVKEQFAPGQGGSASLTISKDRPGGLRAHSPAGKNAPAGRFVMTDNGDGTLSWYVTEPRIESLGSAPDDDVAELDALAPPPRSQRDVQERLGWGGTRALNALRTWRDLRKPEDA